MSSLTKLKRKSSESIVSLNSELRLYYLFKLLTAEIPANLPEV